MTPPGALPSPEDDALVASARREAEAWSEAESAVGAVRPEVDGYRIEGVIHRGGQGVVYRAVEEETGRAVALKILHGGPLAGARERARLEREVGILARLDHEGIVTVRATGEAAGGVFLAMDLVEGRPLDRFVAQRRPPVRELLELFARVCDAVHAAHLHGVIHRDLKPSNVLVDETGAPHVLDFGLAKPTLAAGETVTETGQFVGSLPFASPEQVGGHATVDLRTDVYSLGVLLHLLLTGRLPIDVSVPLDQALARIAHAEPESPARRRPDLDDDVCTIVLRCLAKDRERRYQSAGDLARDMRRHLRGEPIEAKRDSAWTVLWKLLGRHKVEVAAAAVVLAVLVAGGLLSFVQWRRAEDEARRARRAEVDAREAQRRAEEGERELGRRAYHGGLLAAQVALEEGNVARVKAILDQSPKEYRGFEWRRLAWLADRSIRVLPADDGATAVAIAPAGDVVAWGDRRGNVVAADLATGTRRSSEQRHQGAVVSVAWTDDGALASTGHDGRLVVAPPGRAADGVVTSVPGVPARGIGLVTGGVAVVASEDGTVLGVDLETGATRFRDVSASRESILELAADGDLLVAGGSDGSIRRLDGRSGRPLERIPVADGRVSALAVHAPSRRAAVGILGRVHLVALDGGEAPEPFESHGEWIHGLAFSRDGLFLASSGADHAVELRRTRDLRLVRTLRGHEDRVFGVDVRRDGLAIASASLDGTVRIFDPAAPDRARSFRAPNTQVWGVEFLADGRYFVAAVADGTALLHDRRDAAGVPLVLGGHRGAVVAVAVDRRRGRVVTADATGRVRVFRVPDGSPLATFDDVPGFVHAARVDDEGRLLTLREDETLRRRDLETGAVEALARFDRHAVAMDVSPDGRDAFVGDAEGTLHRVDLDDGALVWSVDVHDGRIWSARLSPDGRFVATAGGDGLAALLDARTGAVLHRLLGHRNGVRCVAWSNDGSRVATGSWDRTIRVWEPRSGDEALVLRGVESRVESLAWSADDSALLAATVGGEILLFETIPENEVNR